jgi:hypothetical protein
VLIQLQFSKVFIVMSKQTGGHRNESYLPVMLFSPTAVANVLQNAVLVGKNSI